VDESLVVESYPWGFFDGACQALEHISSIGGILYFGDNHHIKFNANLCPGTNNFA
jgi:hypothetical protein